MIARSALNNVHEDYVMNIAFDSAGLACVYQMWLAAGLSMFVGAQSAILENDSNYAASTFLLRLSGISNA